MPPSLRGERRSLARSRQENYAATPERIVLESERDSFSISDAVERQRPQFVPTPRQRSRSLIEQAPSAAQLRISLSVIALQRQMYTMGMIIIYFENDLQLGH
jgi:hypothetical protein